jgi:uncharacterized protein
MLTVVDHPRAPFFKPVITFDDGELGQAMLALWKQVAHRHPAPDAVVGIASGGLLCAEKLKDSLNLPVFSCAMRRPGTVAKRLPVLQIVLQAVLRAMPYSLSNCIRRIEDQQLARRATKNPPSLRQPSAQLLADVAFVAEAVAAQRLRHVLIVDDAVDSGATLACVYTSLRKAFPQDVSLTTAVITQTRPSPAFYPDVILFRETLCRFPWSLDFRGV